MAWHAMPRHTGPRASAMACHAMPRHTLLFQTFLLPLPPHFSFISPAPLLVSALVPVCENSERFLLSWKKVQISVGLLGVCLRAKGFCFAFLFCFFFVGVIFIFIYSFSLKDFGRWVFSRFLRLMPMQKKIF